MRINLPLMGASFRPASAKDAVREAAIGDPVVLEPDSDNEYDPFAIRVFIDDAHVGFLPRGNQDLFEHLADGGEVVAKIASFEASLKPVIQIEA